MESALIFGAGLLAFYQFLRADTISAIESLTIFLAAGSRILPSILRIQGGVSSFQGSFGAAEYAFKFIDRLKEEEGFNTPATVSPLFSGNEQITDFEPTVSISSVTFSYNQGSKPALTDISLEVEKGSTLAIVGGTGAGKSTLADLILGLLSPQSGQVKVSGVNPISAVKLWPGKIGYVPQTISLFDSDIRQNVAIGLCSEEIDDTKVWKALAQAKLSDFVKSSSDGLDTLIGERGANLSGGQIQRLGLARALYHQPELLILDEATSALDAETEYIITKALESLSGRVTIIIVAHRLTTVRNAKKIAYLENGKLISVGTFENVRKMVPSFDVQANLFGL